MCSFTGSQREGIKECTYGLDQDVSFEDVVSEIKKCEIGAKN